MSDKELSVSAIDLYRLLIGELRYAYTRNNHLQPSAAYGEAKKFLPKMLEADKDVAINTAKQLCEECISDELMGHFGDALDDEFGNMKEAMGFVDWLMSFLEENGASRKPYNYHNYEDLKKAAEELKYDVLEIDPIKYEGDDALKSVKSVIKAGVSKSDADKALFDDILKSNVGYFNRAALKKGKYSKYVVGEKLRIIEPTDHAGEAYAIVLSGSAAEAC